MSSLSQNPADHLMFKCWFQCDNQRAVILTLNLEFLHLLMLVQIKCDLRIAVKTDPVDWRIFKKALSPRILHQFAIGLKGVNSECNRFNPLNCIALYIFCAVFITFGVPDSPVKGNDVRLKQAFLRLSVRFFYRREKGPDASASRQKHL